MRIWEYKYKNMNGNLTALLQLMEKEIYYYAKQNNIKVEIVKYREDELSYSDYVLKRNLALAHGDADILIDNVYNLRPIKKYAGQRGMK